MTNPHEIAEAINEACHGFTFDHLGQPETETGPVVTQNGSTSFDLDLGHLGHFEVIVMPFQTELGRREATTPEYVMHSQQSGRESEMNVFSMSVALAVIFGAGAVYVYFM
jgi:hypothetical protein